MGRRGWGEALVVVTAWAAVASANERHFTYTYETAVLAPGMMELEAWTTARLGRHQRFTRFDERLEFEVGLTERLQTSLYLNFSGTSEAVGGALSNHSDFDGVSNEWKYKVSDAVADPVGFALYGELFLAPTEIELEGRLILDKRIGPWLLAVNGVYEYELELGEPGRSKTDHLLEGVGGVSYFLAPRVAAGFEVRNTNVVSDAGWEFSALFAGPVVSYAGDRWWVTLTVLPQLPALRKTDRGGTFVLTDHERFNARLLFSFQL